MEVTKPTLAEPPIRKFKSGLASRGLLGFVFGLRFKLIFITFGIALISVLVFFFLSLDLQRRQLINYAESSVTVLSNAIKGNLWHAMLTNDWAMFQEIVQAEMGSRDINSIRVLNSQGVVGFSSKPDEVGIYVQQTDPTCQFCHTDEAPATNKTIIFPKGSSDKVLLNVNLITNQMECYECHEAEKKVLGLLMIEVPMTVLNEQLSSGYIRIGLVAVGTFVLLIGLLVPVLNLFVLKPVDELAKGVAEIGAGNLDHQVVVSNQDELGELAVSFDDMRRQLKATHLEMDSRNQELSVFNEVALTISQSLDLQQILDFALESLIDRLGMEMGLIFLLDGGSGRFILRASRGAPPAMCQEIERRRIHRDMDISWEVANTNQSYFVADVSKDSRLQGLWEETHGRSYILVPLRSKGKAVGTMGLAGYAGKPVSPRVVEVLEAVGNEIGMVIENAQLYRQLHYLAVLEERDRLAREMHDDLAQALGYLNVKAAITEDLLKSNELEQARESLIELKRVAKLVYTDIREAIFNLRTTVSTHTGFIMTLQGYLEGYRAHYGLTAQLILVDDKEAELSGEAAIQILRIIQEALTNVRKHSNTNRAWIRYQLEGDHLRISIEDDGRGFLPPLEPNADPQHIGIQIMRERAESIGGSLELNSQPGQGTSVIVRVPINSQYDRM